MVSVSSRSNEFKGSSLKFDRLLSFPVQFYHIIGFGHILGDFRILKSVLVHFLAPSAPIGIDVYKDFLWILFRFRKFYGFFPLEPGYVLGHTDSGKKSQSEEKNRTVYGFDNHSHFHFLYFSLNRNINPNEKKGFLFYGYLFFLGYK